MVGTSAHRRDRLQTIQNRLKVDFKKKARKIPEIWPPGELLFIVIERAWRGGRVGHLILTASTQLDPWGHFRNRSKWDSVSPHRDQTGKFTIKKLVLSPLKHDRSKGCM